MDSNGWVPLYIPMQYTNVCEIDVTYPEVVRKIKYAISKCKNIEYDEKNELVRYKANWQLFLLKRPEEEKFTYLRKGDTYVFLNSKGEEIIVNDNENSQIDETA